MKIKVALTANELKDVQETIVNTALDNGILYTDDEDDVSALFDVVDEALQAMGIDIVEEEEIEEDDFEEPSDPIADLLYVLDDGRTAIHMDDAYMILDIIEKVGIDRGLSKQEATEAAKHIFIQIGEDYGIDCVEVEEKKDAIEVMIFEHDGKRTITKSDADELLHATIEVVNSMDDVPFEKKDELIAATFIRVCDNYGIESILMEGE